jgi:hypothetical protein
VCCLFHAPTSSYTASCAEHCRWQSWVPSGVRTTRSRTVLTRRHAPFRPPPGQCVHRSDQISCCLISDQRTSDGQLGHQGKKKRAALSPPPPPKSPQAMAGHQPPPGAPCPEVSAGSSGSRPPAGRRAGRRALDPLLPHGTHCCVCCGQLRGHSWKANGLAVTASTMADARLRQRPWPGAREGATRGMKRSGQTNRQPFDQGFSKVGKNTARHLQRQANSSSAQPCQSLLSHLASAHQQSQRPGHQGSGSVTRPSPNRQSW